MVVRGERRLIISFKCQAVRGWRGICIFFYLQKGKVEGSYYHLSAAVYLFPPNIFLYQFFFFLSMGMVEQPRASARGLGFLFSTTVR